MSGNLQVFDILGRAFEMFRQQGLWLALEFAAVGVAVDAVFWLLLPEAIAPVLGPSQELPFAQPVFYFYFATSSIAYSLVAAFAFTRFWLARQQPPADPRHAILLIRTTLVPLLVLQLLVDLAYLAGYFAFILPAVLVLAFSTPLMPALLVERLGWNALKRCAALTRRHMGRLMLLWAMPFFGLLAAMVLSYILFRAGTPEASSPSIAKMIFDDFRGDLLANLFSALSIMIIVVAYEDMIAIEGSGTSGDLPDIFR